MKLIYAQGACSLSVHILLEEMKMDYEAIKVSLKDKTVLDTYNPKSYVPALILDDGTVLTEATSILQYLSHEQKSAFLPESGMDRIKCIEWLTYISTELHKGAMPLFYREKLPADFIQQTEDKIYKRLQFLEDQLRDQAFIINNGYTIADMYALAILRILTHVGIKFDQLPEIASYKQYLEASATIKRVIQREKDAEVETRPNESPTKLHFFYHSNTYKEARNLE